MHSLPGCPELDRDTHEVFREGSKAFLTLIKNMLLNRQWEYLGEVPSAEDVPKTQEWGGEWPGRWWPFRRKNCFSEAKLGKMVQTGAM